MHKLTSGFRHDIQCGSATDFVLNPSVWKRVVELNTAVITPKGDGYTEGSGYSGLTTCGISSINLSINDLNSTGYQCRR